MKKVSVCIVGAGNISNTRHIPALKRCHDVEIHGVLSNKLERSRSTADKHNITNYAVVSDGARGRKDIQALDWFDEIDAVVIGAPPHQHYQLVKLFLELGKHVLVEKPMMMQKSECDELIDLAKKRKKIFYVMHNFQYANKMMKLNDIIKSKKYGDIVSITEVQFTNHDRRLPEWYNALPMGLFYDEAAHFLYLLERHAGQVTIDSSYAVYDQDGSKTTPITLSVGATAGETPVTMMLNFHAPVCEWYYMVNFKKHILVYDFFKDILIDLPSDNEHLAGDILRNSLRYTWQYWTQFFMNGLRMVAGRLLYGHDVVMRSFVESIRAGKAKDASLTASNGRTNVVSINEIVNKANRRKQ